MTKKEYTLILDTLHHAKDVISVATSKDGEYHSMVEIEDIDVSGMFFTINDMCILLSKKMENM